MKVILKYETITGAHYRCKHPVNIKQAIEYYKENYKDRTDIVKVWLSHWDGWHHCNHKTLKDIIKK